jgi:hypothetical protein
MLLQDSQETQKLCRNIQTLSEAMDRKLQNLGEGFNSMNLLLTEHVKEKESESFNPGFKEAGPRR